jgi:hypothetical protein
MASVQLICISGDRSNLGTARSTDSTADVNRERRPNSEQSSFSQASASIAVLLCSVVDLRLVVQASLYRH